MSLFLFCFIVYTFLKKFMELILYTLLLQQIIIILSKIALGKMIG